MFSDKKAEYRRMSLEFDNAECYCCKKRFIWMETLND